MNPCPTCHFRWDVHTDRMAQGCYLLWVTAPRHLDVLPSPVWSDGYRDRFGSWDRVAA